MIKHHIHYYFQKGFLSWHRAARSTYLCSWRKQRWAGSLQACVPGALSPEYIPLPALACASRQLVFQDQLLISSPVIFNFMRKKSLWVKTRLLTNSCRSFPSAEEIVPYHPWLMGNACTCLSDTYESTLVWQLLHVPWGTRPSQK